MYAEYQRERQLITVMTGLPLRASPFFPLRNDDTGTLGERNQTGVPRTTRSAFSTADMSNGSRAQLSPSRESGSAFRKLRSVHGNSYLLEGTRRTSSTRPPALRKSCRRAS